MPPRPCTRTYRWVGPLLFWCPAAPATTPRTTVDRGDNDLTLRGDDDADAWSVLSQLELSVFARANRGERRDPPPPFDPRNEQCEPPTRAVSLDELRFPRKPIALHVALCARLMVVALNTGNKLAKPKHTRTAAKHLYTKDAMSMRDDPAGEPMRAEECAHDPRVRTKL